MASTGLDDVGKTLQTTNIRLGEIMAELGPAPQAVGHVLSAMLRTLRNRVPLDPATCLGAQLPFLARSTCCDQRHEEPGRLESVVGLARDWFGARIGRERDRP